MFAVEVDEHSPVLYPEVRMVGDNDVDVSSRSSGLSSQQIQEIVDHHNQLRAGEGASNMEVMVCGMYLDLASSILVCFFLIPNAQFNCCNVKPTWRHGLPFNCMLLQSLASPRGGGGQPS